VSLPAIFKLKTMKQKNIDPLTGLPFPKIGPSISKIFDSITAAMEYIKNYNRK